MSAQTRTPSQSICPYCGSTVSETSSLELKACPGCGRESVVLVFPAAHLGQPRNEGALDAIEGQDAGCYYHPKKRAAAHCDSCGRFLCFLCDIEMGSKHICPVCVEKPEVRSAGGPLERRRILYDRAAFWVSVLPLVFFFFLPFSIITAPLAIFMSIKYWDAPRGITGGGRMRLILALFISLLQIAGWTFLLAYIVSKA